MNNVQMLTNAVSNFYTAIGKAQGFSDSYLRTDLLEVNFYSLYQTLRRESQQVYNYYYATENPDLLDYRGPKMFPCGALLLYRSEDYFMESEGIATGHYLELWLLEDLTLAVTACFTITHNSNPTSEYRFFKGSEWPDTESRFDLGVFLNHLRELSPDVLNSEEHPFFEP